MKYPTTPPFYYQFNEWKVCFDDLREMIEEGRTKNLRLVLSRHPYSSGYWIEQSIKEVGPDDTAYTPDAAFELEKRIIEEHGRASMAGGSPQFVA